MASKNLQKSSAIQNNSVTLSSVIIAIIVCNSLYFNTIKVQQFSLITKFSSTYISSNSRYNYNEAIIIALSLTGMAQAGGDGKTWVDYVNPYIGNISHLLVPTFPTVQLPNSMLRVYPERADFTADRINGLPLIVTHHRERSAFNLSVSARFVTT